MDSSLFSSSFSFLFCFILKFKFFLVAYFVYGSLSNIVDLTDFSIMMMMIAITNAVTFSVTVAIIMGYHFYLCLKICA